MSTKTFNITLDERINNRLMLIKKHFELGNKTDAVSKCVDGYFDALQKVGAITGE